MNRRHLATLQSLAALALLVVGLSLSTDAFLTTQNGLTVLRQIAVNTCLSMGMTLVIVAGGIDLSIGSVLALAAALATHGLVHGVDVPAWGVHIQLTVAGAVVVGVGVGALAGCVNGLLITRLKLPPFIVTLATLSVARGLTELWTGGFPITGLGADFGWLGTGYVARVPVPVLITAGLAVAFALVLQRSVFGRYLYAVGGAEPAARASGINVERVKLLAYTLCGSLAGCGGLLLAARLDSATPTLGEGYELDSIAAVVIGGASLTGGRGTIVGTILGCLIIGVLNNGLALLDVSPFWQKVVKGLVILMAVAIDRMTREQR